MKKGETVIVIDNSNYWEGFREPCPFKARIIGFYESGILVLSENTGVGYETGKGYELQPNQILDFLQIEEIKEIDYKLLLKGLQRTSVRLVAN
jgi:hypothetical protein